MQIWLSAKLRILRVANPVSLTMTRKVFCRKFELLIPYLLIHRWEHARKWMIKELPVLYPRSPLIVLRFSSLSCIRHKLDVLEFVTVYLWLIAFMSKSAFEQKPPTAISALYYHRSSSKKELQLFNRVNIPIENLLTWAHSGAVLIQSLLCYRVTFGQNS